MTSRSPRAEASRIPGTVMRLLAIASRSVFLAPKSEKPFRSERRKGRASASASGGLARRSAAPEVSVPFLRGSGPLAPTFAPSSGALGSFRLGPAGGASRDGGAGLVRDPSGTNGSVLDSRTGARIICRPRAAINSRLWRVETRSAGAERHEVLGPLDRTPQPVEQLLEVLGAVREVEVPGVDDEERRALEVVVVVVVGVDQLGLVVARQGLFDRPRPPLDPV